jgi:hypothetical protein
MVGSFNLRLAVTEAELGDDLALLEGKYSLNWKQLAKAKHLQELSKIFPRRRSCHSRGLAIRVTPVSSVISPIRPQLLLRAIWVTVPTVQLPARLSWLATSASFPALD